MVKLNITLGGPVLNNYINIDPLPRQPQQDLIQAEPDKLDHLVDNNECSQIIAEGVLDFYPLGARYQVITHWLSKLSHGGTLVLTCRDIHDLSRQIHRGEISGTSDINNALYGAANHMWTLRKSVASLEDTIQMCLANGQTEVVAVKYIGADYVLTVKRK
jgi:hypothetical protein